jgi:hypothetical protein
MYRRIGLLSTALAIAIMLNARPAKAQVPQVAAGGAGGSAQFGGKPAPRLAPLVANAQTAVACNLCFTCGGDWPIFAGTQAFSFSDNPAVERGSSCGGGFTTNSNDKNPFLCCR